MEALEDALSRTNEAANLLNETPKLAVHLEPYHDPTIPGGVIDYAVYNIESEEDILKGSIENMNLGPDGTPLLKYRWTISGAEREEFETEFLDWVEKIGNTFENIVLNYSTDFGEGDDIDSEG